MWHITLNLFMFALRMFFFKFNFFFINHEWCWDLHKHLCLYWQVGKWPMPLTHKFVRGHLGTQVSPRWTPLAPCTRSIISSTQIYKKPKQHKITLHKLYIRSFGQVPHIHSWSKLANLYATFARANTRNSWSGNLVILNTLCWTFVIYLKLQVSNIPGPCIWCPWVPIWWVDPMGAPGHQMQGLATVMLSQ